jgi:hypothetical protein
VTELFADSIEEQLSSVEVFILGVFCFVHDIGMASRPGMTPEQLYRAHNVYAQEYAFGLGHDGSLEPDEVEAVAALCLMHNKDLNRARVHFSKIRSINARLGVIFAMFRLVDMLDVETQPGEMLRIKPEIVAQVIGEIDFDPSCREITIWKGQSVGDRDFRTWSNFFDAKLQTLNEELRSINAAVTWQSAGTTSILPASTL